jgi:4-hydroxy-3-polyprenylbenzoate decarboxylase
VQIFLGITGASGAPYAARLLEALTAAGAQVGVCISDAGVQVCATELYGDISLPREEVTARLVDGRDRVTVVGLRDYTTPYASGSAKVDAYVVCPCSMSTAASIAAGAMGNLVQRAASVALKEERKLVLVPRETPLSLIHLENQLRLRRAGATVVIAAPGFYHAPQTIDDLVNFVVARCLDQLGIDQTLVGRWGQ